MHGSPPDAQDGLARRRARPRGPNHRQPSGRALSARPGEPAIPPRPNALWLSDFTYVATWQGFVFVAFIIDAYARRIVGWRVSRAAHAGFVLDALEQASADRRPFQGGGLVHHSDRRPT